MTAKPNHTQDAPLRPAQILDPYPERSTQSGGVRQHTHLPAAQARKVTANHQTVEPFPFAAIPTTPNSAESGGWRFPWASTLLYTSGQLVLAVVIAAGRVGPGLGVTVGVSWMCCGALLIASQVLSTDTSRTAPEQATRPTRTATARSVTAILRLALTRRAEAVGWSGAGSRKDAGCAGGAGKPLGNTRKLLLLTDTGQEAGQW